MAYALGVLLFALAILISVSLHEAGHMVTAKAFGMKVTRYFIGFGPRIWSFRRGETEYGLKAIPAGGFVKIVGMTPQDDDVAPEDESRVMWRYPVWKRTIVMSAGSATHFLLAFVALWLTAMFIGLPNPALASPIPAHVSVQDCVVVKPEARACRPDDPASPAKQAGLRNGDKVTTINGTAVGTFEDLVREVRKTPPGKAAIIGYERDGVRQEAVVTLAAVQRPPVDDPGGAVSEVSAFGVSMSLPPGVPASVKYGPGGALAASVDYSGTMVSATFQALKRFPEKVPRLWAALTGEKRDVDTPISVVGASRLGGEAVQHGVWELFISLFIGLNFFVGIFNLLPILPLDGGHIAIAWFERVRSWLYAKLGRPDPGRVDYYKLMPVTYAIIFIFGGFTLLTVAADIVNPITIFSR